MTVDDRTPSNGDSKGQTYEQVIAASEAQVRNLVGIPVSLREFQEQEVRNLQREIERVRTDFLALIATREAELRRTIKDLEELRGQEKESDRQLIERVEIDLRRQFDQIREQVDQRDLASKEAVTKAEQAATTAISAAAATTQTAVTKAETSASNAIIQAAEATKSAVDGVKEGFDQQIKYLRERFDVYTSQHKEVHDSEHIAADKFERTSQEWARALTEFQRSSERAGESFVKRDVLDDVRRTLEQTVTQRYESLSAAGERAERATNERIAALEVRSQNTVGRDGANVQYIGYLIAAVGIIIAIVSFLTR